MKAIILTGLYLLVIGCGAASRFGELEQRCHTRVEIGEECSFVQSFEGGKVRIQYRIEWKRGGEYGGTGEVVNESKRVLQNTRLNLRTSEDPKWISEVELSPVLGGEDYVPFKWSLYGRGYPVMEVAFE